MPKKKFKLKRFKTSKIPRTLGGLNIPKGGLLSPSLRKGKGIR